MPRDADHYDLFVSYARRDNRGDWISRFVDELLVEHAKFSPGRTLTRFFDQQEIGSLDDWRHRIYHGLAGSRLFLAFISPNYFASEWCRREWRSWIDLEIAKHVLSSGAAPIYIVEVPGFAGSLSEQEVARQVAQLCQVPGPAEAFAADASPMIRQLRRRQYNAVQAFYSAGIESLRREDLRRVLETLARDLNERAKLVRLGAASRTTVPPYNKRFSGRLDELMALREQLKDDRAGVISGVHGLGGIGKTELAFTYAHAFAAAYPGGRFLVPCEGKSLVREALLHLDEIFRSQISDEERQTSDKHFAAIRACLGQRLDELGHILLVLDNVSEAGLLAAEQTDSLTVLGPKLHLLATTRLLPGPTGQIRWLALGELPENDALELLEKHRSFAADAEREAARKIVKRLGGFALAVELVAAWLAAHPKVPCAGFLERLGLEELEALDAVAEDRDVELRRHDHERRLAAVLGPTLKTLANETPAALRALEFAAFLAPDQVPWPWLKALVEPDIGKLGRRAGWRSFWPWFKSLVTRDGPEISKPPEPGYEDPWGEICRALWKYGLVSRGERAGCDAEEVPDSRIVRVHRLVQDLVRGKLSTEEKAARQMAVNQLAGARVIELEKTTRWMEARWELEPLDALARWWAEAGHTRAAALLGHIGWHWKVLAEWSRAEPLMRWSLAIVEASFGPEHPKIAPALNNLAQLLQATNRLAEAEPLMRRALAIGEASLGPDHPDVATRLDNLGSLLQATNRLAEAEPLMRRAQAIDEAFFGLDHPEVALRLNNLATLLQETNRLPEAELLTRRALAIAEASFGPEYPSIATNLNNLAQLLYATHRLAEAEPLMRRALAIDEASFGPEHPDVATHLNNLAMLLQDTNRLAEAEPLFRRALAIDEVSFGPEHPKVATELRNLAWLLHDTNRREEAEPLFRRALAINEASFGPEDPKVATDLNNLALLFGATNRREEAELLFRRALAIDEASFGPEHSGVSRDLSNLAQLLKDTNRREEAELLFRRALAIDEASFGPEHSGVSRDLSNLAQLLKDTNRLAEAEPLMRRALAIDETSLGPDHANFATTLGDLALLLQATNRLTEAETLMRRSLAIFEASLGPDHSNVAIRMINLASLLKAANRLAEAEPLFRRAMVIDEASFGPDHSNVARDLNDLALLLQATNRMAEAEPLLRRALAIYETSLGPDHPNFATALGNLAQLLCDTSRRAEAEPLMRRCLGIFTNFAASAGHEHQNMATVVKNYASLLAGMGLSQDEIRAQLNEIGQPFGVDLNV